MHSPQLLIARQHISIMQWTDCQILLYTTGKRGLLNKPQPQERHTRAVRDVRGVDISRLVHFPNKMLACNKVLQGWVDELTRPVADGGAGLKVRVLG